MNTIDNENEDYEKVYFTCSIKNSWKNYYYIINIINPDKSLGDFTSFETEEILSEEEKSTIEFKTKIKGIKFRFSERQLYMIEIKKRKINCSNYDSYKRKTVMASLVSSPNSTYERQLDQKNENSEIFSIKLNINMSDNICISEFDYNQSITDFFQNNGKIKLNFLFDFSHKNSDNNYLNSINIYYNFLIDIYNLCHFYTVNDELNMYGAGVQNNFESSSVFKLNIEKSSISINNIDKIKDSFLSVLNSKLEEKDLYICSFIENCVNEINNNSNYNVFNVLFICLRYIPEDFKNVVNKIGEIKRKKLPFSIIIIGLGDNFGDGENIYSQISEFSNTKFIQIKDNSMDKLKEKVRLCLNHLKTNIIRLKQYISTEPENSLKDSNSYSNNEENNEDNEEENNEDNEEENINNSLEDEKEKINEEKLDEIKEINNSEQKIEDKNKFKEKMKLKSSNNESMECNSNFNPYLQNILSKKNSLKSNNNEKELNNSSQNEINKDNKSQNKMVDSNTKTESNSNNNEIINS